MTAAGRPCDSGDSRETAVIEVTALVTAAPHLPPICLVVRAGVLARSLISCWLKGKGVDTEQEKFDESDSESIYSLRK